MSCLPEHEQQTFLIQKTAKPLVAPSSDRKNTRRSFFRLAVDMWYAIKGYTADDIGRLKEGGIQQVEGKGQVAIAEAKVKVAEAAEKHAKAERERAEGFKAKAEGVKAMAEAYAIRKKADGEFAKDTAAAFNNVVQAISVIKQAGGNVAFDLDQIEKLISQGKKEFADDRQLQDVKIEIGELEENKE